MKHEQTHYPDWKKLTPLPICARPDEKEGAKFVVIDGGHRCFRRGDIVELIKNDGTACPYFKRINGKKRLACRFSRLAPLPQTEEKKMKKLIPFTDEFDWCEEGVLVNIEGSGDLYAVRAKGNKVWTVDNCKKPYEIKLSHQLTTHPRSICQKVIHEEHRPLTNRELAEFLQDRKGMVKDANDHMVSGSTCYDCEDENKPVCDNTRFRFRGTEDWHPVTTELYEIAKVVNS